MFDSLALGNINWLGVVVATLTCTVLGGIWFAALFGKQYVKSLGRDTNEKIKMTPIFYIGPMLCTLINVITSAVLIQVLNIETIKNALLFGGLVGLGYMVSTMTNVAINPNFPRPFYYAALNGPYFFICSLITSVILVSL